MIVTLKEGADPGLVRDALAGLGLWTSSFEGRRGSVQLFVHSHSGDVDRDRLLSVAGVAAGGRPDGTCSIR